MKMVNLQYRLVVLLRKPNLKFPRFQLGYATHVGRGVSLHAGIGASQTIYSASLMLFRISSRL